ncbi:hypothetical protein GOC74_00050 [Halomicrobium mukohataei]|uniref:JAB domain-containing protein n=1 Tax=Halomicrobium mukohataei TaxID=57705 RepID=A0A847UBT5_9EURY|nr:hypothetical protein [Halomicrobium mukohataei]
MDQETGGILLGRRHSKDAVFCIAATRPGPNAEHHRAEFSPDTDYAQSIINDYRTTYDVVWIGTWHKHPGAMNRLSSGDINQMREFVKDPDLMDEIIAIITTYSDDVVRVNPFYMDHTLKVARTDLEIIDDSDEYESELRLDVGSEEHAGANDTHAGYEDDHRTTGRNEPKTIVGWLSTLTDSTRHILFD